MALPPAGEKVLEGKAIGSLLTQTERAFDRRREDYDYVPVIVKRSDQAKTHPDDILERAILEGSEQLKRGKLSLFLSAMAAGLILGFAAMAVAVVTMIGSHWGLTAAGQRLLMALVYPLAFVICLQSGTQLFTEHTATAVYPVLDRKFRLWSLLRLWCLVLLGNLVGATIIAYFLSATEVIVQAQSGYAQVAKHLLAGGSGDIIFSAILAGWLMAQGGWMVLGNTNPVGQIMGIYMVTFLIGLGGLHHSIAGTAELMTAFFLDPQLSFRLIASTIGLAIVGNLIGGSVFVATLNYAHIRSTQAKMDARRPRQNPVTQL